MKSDLEKALANVPVINLKSFKENSVNALMEKYNICGSVKAKAVYWMLKTAVENNQLDTSKIVLEASSGNTAISLAYFSKLFGFKVEIIAPSSTAQCKKRLIQSYGAKLIEVDGITDDCIDLRTKMHEENKGKYYLPDQFTNEANLYAHYNLTGPRIVETLGKDLDFFCAGLGTAGTVIGAGKYLKEINPNIKILAINTVEKIEGLRNFKTSKVVVPFYEENKDKIIDETIDVTQEDMKAGLNMYLTEGYSVGLSSGAILSGLSRWLKGKEGLKGVTIAPDGGDFYL